MDGFNSITSRGEHSGAEADYSTIAGHFKPIGEHNKHDKLTSRWIEDRRQGFRRNHPSRWCMHHAPSHGFNHHFHAPLNLVESLRLLCKYRRMEIGFRYFWDDSENVLHFESFERWNLYRLFVRNFRSLKFKKLNRWRKNDDSRMYHWTNSINCLINRISEIGLKE